MDVRRERIEEEDALRPGTGQIKFPLNDILSYVN